MKKRYDLLSFSTLAVTLYGKEYFFMNTLDKHINIWASIIKEEQENNLNVTILRTKADIKKYIDEILSLILNAYKDKGGFKGPTDIRSMLKDTDLAKVVFSDENKIIACALYRIDAGGYKRFVSAGIHNNMESFAAVEKIIKTDIEPYNDWYWVEASGVIEKLFSKNNGNPIPNYIAVDILKDKLRKHAEIDESDNIHYFRVIGGERYRKSMFGFNSKETYDKVMSEIKDYELFKNGTKDDIGILTENMSITQLNKAMSYISFMSDLHLEEGINEIFPSWADTLKKSQKIVQDVHDKTTDKNIKERCVSLLRRAKMCLEEMTLLIPRKIDLKDFSLDINKYL